MDSTESITDAFEVLSPAQKTMIAGGVAGSAAKTVTAPLSRLTILYQIGNVLEHESSVPGCKESKEFKGSLLNSFRRVVREEGFKAFWKGNLTSVLHRFPYSAINFSSYEICRKFFSSTLDTSESPMLRFVSGAIAGGLACTACYPLDIVRTRLTVALGNRKNSSHPRGIFKNLIHIVSTEGFSGLYRGLPVSLGVSVPNLAIGFTAYGTLKESLISTDSKFFTDDKTGKLNSAGCLVSGAISGIMSSLIIFPADVVRRRLQVLGLAHESANVVPDKILPVKSSLAYFDKGHIIYHPQEVFQMSSPDPSVTFKYNPPQRSTGWKEAQIIYRSEGLRGFYRGIAAELLKVTPMVGATFFVYEMTLSLLGHSNH